MDMDDMDRFRMEAISPSKPRLHKDAFQWYFKFMKSLIRRSHPGQIQIYPGALLRRTAKENWDNLGHEEKAKFFVLKDNDLHRFKVENEEYKLKLSRAFGVDYGRRSPNGYIIFSNEKRSEVYSQHPNLPAKDVMKILAGMWQNLSREKRQQYKEKHLQAVTAAKKGSMFCQRHHSREEINDVSLLASFGLGTSAETSTSSATMTSEAPDVGGSDDSTENIYSNACSPAPSMTLSLSYIS